jgi:Tol biopolymer transport system component
MTDVELEVADSFDRIFPAPVAAADWHDVLGRAELRSETRPRFGRQHARHRRIVALAVAALIVVMGAATAYATAHRLFFAAGRSTWHSTPAWSPDGGAIAFVSNRDGNPEIYVMNANGSELQRLTQETLRDGGPAWSPDGRKIAFERWVDHHPDIYVMNADGSGQRSLTTGSGIDVLPVWSPDGRKIAFVRRVAFGGQPRPSGPPGFHIVFRNYLYVVNADGGGLRMLTRDQAHDLLLPPVWSPNGRTIRLGRTVVNADGNGLLTLPRSIPASGVWSPDRRKIAFVSFSQTGPPPPNYDVYVVNADGSGLRRLTRNPAYDSNPLWSPGGRRIAFRSTRDGNPELYVMDSDGSGQRRLTSSPGSESRFAWSPDGRRIAFLSRGEVVVVNADEGG